MFVGHTKELVSSHFVRRRLMAVLLVITILLGVSVTVDPKGLDFAQAAPDPSKLFPIAIDGKFGFIDGTGKMILLPKYDEAQSFQEGLAAVRIGRKWGFIDGTGKLIIKPQWDCTCGFKSGMAEVELCSKWGYIDRSGTVVVKPQYNYTYGYNGDVSMVCIETPEDGQMNGYIDKKGNPLTEMRAGMLTLTCGLVPYGSGDLWGYADSKGKVLIKPRFDQIGDFSNGLAPVLVEQKWGYINKAGEMKISPQFDFAREFSEGLAIVSINERAGVIDCKGQWVERPRYDLTNWNSYRSSRAVVQDKKEKYAFLDEKGQLITDFKYELVDDFYEGVASVTEDRSNWGFINRSGKMVIKPQFRFCSRFENGLAKVQIQNNWGYIDKAGKIVRMATWKK